MDKPHRNALDEPLEWSDVKSKLMQLELGKVMKGKDQGLKKSSNHMGDMATSAVTAEPPVALPVRQSNNLSVSAKPRTSKQVPLPTVPSGCKKGVAQPESEGSHNSADGSHEANNQIQNWALVDEEQGIYEDPWDLHSKRLELESKFHFAKQQQQVELEVQMQDEASVGKESKNNAIPGQMHVPHSRYVQVPPHDVVADGHWIHLSRHSPDASDRPKSSSRTNQPLYPDVSLRNHQFQGGQTTPHREDSRNHSHWSRQSHQPIQSPPDMLGDMHKHQTTQSSPNNRQKHKPRFYYHSSQDIIDNHLSPKSNFPTSSESDNHLENEYEDPWDKRAAELHREIARRHHNVPMPQKQEDSKPSDVYEDPWDTRAKPKMLSQLYSQGSSSDGSTQSSPTSSQHQSPKKKLSLDIGPRSAHPSLGERVDPTVPLEKQGWYHGAISRNDAENLLRVHKEGSYLVRKSESNKQDFSLSLKSSQGFMHMKIAKVDGKLILGQFSQPFNSIPEMMLHYSLSKLPIKGVEYMTLQHPVINELL